MSRSLAAAEKAAIDGEGPEWDTQMCEAAQKEFLSSPAGTPIRVSLRHDLVASSSNLNLPPSVSLTDTSILKPPSATEAVNIEIEINHHDNDTRPFPPSNPPRLADNANPPIVHYRRNASGQLRPFTAAGEQTLPPGFAEKLAQARQAMMEDLTQKSSLSLTQENSESVYEQFKHGTDKNTVEGYPSTDTPDDTLLLPTQANPDSLRSRYASARTESTAVTYQEGDAGHIMVDFPFQPTDQDMDSDVEDDVDDDQAYMEASQEASFSAPQVEVESRVYDPQTPAPAVNPFTGKAKGSVMKAFDLFGATQPSSVGRPLETPVSARPPSPEIYNENSSPMKRGRVMSSPLNFGRAVESETSPLQSSVRKLLTHSLSMDSPLTTRASSDTGPQKPAFEPRAYVSMKESQERRKRDQLDEDSEDSDSDFDSDIRPVGRSLQAETNLRKELSSVEIRKDTQIKQLAPKDSTPSTSASAPIPAVEVPSTRHQEEKDYISQSEGHDARDRQMDEETQSQDDVIVDSQALPTLPQTSFVSAGEKSSSQPDEPAVDIAHVAKSSLLSARPSSNRDETQTPTTSKLLADIDTVPETSPPNKHQNTTPMSPVGPESPEDEEVIRPMGDIATFSFGGPDDDVFLDDIAGLTQDPDFEKARRIEGSSPRMPKVRNVKASRPIPLPIVRAASVAASSPSEKSVERHKAQDGAKHAPTKFVRQVFPSRDASTEPNSPLTSSLSEIPTPPQPTYFKHLSPENDENGTSKSGSPASPQQRDDNNVMDDVSEVAEEPLFADDDHEATRHDGSNDGFNKAPAEHIESENELPKHKPAPVIPKHSPSKTYSRRQTSKPKASNTTRKPAGAAKKPSKLTLNRVVAANASITPRSSPLSNVVTPDTIKSISSRRASKRQNGAIVTREESVGLTRSSTRQSVARESSEDPLALATSGTALFAKMAFAISYVDPDKDRERVTQLIKDNGGAILDQGFDSLFETIQGKEATEFRLSTISKQLGFTALIADEHSRKVKYLQALALGLPCISGHWICACVSKGRIIDWAPYLLCAGMSSVLHAAKSRMLTPYSAESSRLEDIVEARNKLLRGVSVLFVAGKSKAEIEKRNACSFLAHALGPTRITRVGDIYEARKKLVESAEDDYDLICIDGNVKQAENVIFGLASAPAKKGGKRKRIFDVADVDDLPAPKKIRVIADETMVQSLIMGQLLE